MFKQYQPLEQIRISGIKLMWGLLKETLFNTSPIIRINKITDFKLNGSITGMGPDGIPFYILYGYLCDVPSTITSKTCSCVILLDGALDIIDVKFFSKGIEQVVKSSLVNHETLGLVKNPWSFTLCEQRTSVVGTTVITQFEAVGVSIGFQNGGELMYMYLGTEWGFSDA